MHEYANKSIITAIEKGTPVQRKNIINEIVDKNDKDRLINLTKHPYGNFVLQKIFTVEKKRHRLVAGAGKLLLGVWDIAGLLHETGAVGAEDIIDEGLSQACGLALGVHVQQARDLIRA